MNYKIVTKDYDTGEWRDAGEEDGMNCDNCFPDRHTAEQEARHLKSKCAYSFQTRVVREDA